MIGRYRVSLDGVQMDSINDKILILDVGYSPIEFDRRENSVAGLDGYDISNTYLQKRAVTITFEIHRYNIVKRNEICQAVNKWASGGGQLVINDRDGQFLQVQCEQYADITSVRNWTDPLTLTFSTVAIPYWQNSAASSLALSGKNATGTLKLKGNYGNALVTVSAVANAKVTSFKAEVGNTQIVLKGMNIASGQRLVIDYQRGRFLRIRVDGKSVMGSLQPSSTDNLLAPCGASTKCTVVSDGKMTTTIASRGLWL